MPRPPLGDRAMSSTERVHRHRDRLPPLSAQERRRLLREMGGLLDVE